MYIKRSPMGSPKWPSYRCSTTDSLGLPKEAGRTPEAQAADSLLLFTTRAISPRSRYENPCKKTGIISNAGQGCVRDGEPSFCLFFRSAWLGRGPCSSTTVIHCLYIKSAYATYCRGFLYIRRLGRAMLWAQKCFPFEE